MIKHPQHVCVCASAHEISPQDLSVTRWEHRFSQIQKQHADDLLLSVTVDLL